MCSAERRKEVIGTGSVDFPRFIAVLKEIGCKGILSVEREELDQAQRAADIWTGLELLRRITGRQ
ncbi:MAG: hypothetical protein WB676_25965 [Bryobacteraceae bacterium]